MRVLSSGAVHGSYTSAASITSAAPTGEILRRMTSGKQNRQIKESAASDVTQDSDIDQIQSDLSDAQDAIATLQSDLSDLTDRVAVLEP